ncbi:MAG TPA: hypothetical protein VLS90_17195 [Thermodesulfobacteriota bacterium]|nr:hypothetical protein [Thermodesulfobacteriota bacterium]
MQTNLKPDDKMVGEILVERNIISLKHLQMALDRQKTERGKSKYLGEILIELGIPQEEINTALDAYKKRRPIGQILLDLKIITPDQLQMALHRQARSGARKPLGKLLVEMGFITYNGYMDALSKHFNMTIVSLRGFFPSPALQKAVGKAYARKNEIVVLEDYSATIKLALAEPDPLVMDELRRRFPAKRKVEFYLADRVEVKYCLREV